MSYFITGGRKTEIQEILSDLESLKSEPNYREAVALNIEFFKAIRYPISYFWWAIFRAPRIRRNRAKIVELGDLPLPRWQWAILKTLSEFEAGVPAMLLPIRQRIVAELGRLKETQKGPIVVSSLGCGGMELERQVMYELVRTRFNLPVVFVGVDYSPIVPDIVTSKFNSLLSKGLVQVRTLSHLGADDLRSLKLQVTSHMFSVVLLSTNAFELKDLPGNSFNLVYHTRLKHHLTCEEGRELDEMATHLAPKVIEFDDLFSIRTFVLASIFAWRFPAGLGGQIFSYLRSLSKKESMYRQSKDWRVDIIYTKPIWSYLRIYDRAEVRG